MTQHNLFQPDRPSLEKTEPHCVRTQTNNVESGQRLTKKWKCKISLKAKDMPEYSYNDSQIKQLTPATKEVQT